MIHLQGNPFWHHEVAHRAIAVRCRGRFAIRPAENAGRRRTSQVGRGRASRFGSGENRCGHIDRFHGGGNCRWGYRLRRAHGFGNRLGRRGRCFCSGLGRLRWRRGRQFRAWLSGCRWFLRSWRLGGRNGRCFSLWGSGRCRLSERVLSHCRRLSTAGRFGRDRFGGRGGISHRPGFSGCKLVRCVTVLNRYRGWCGGCGNRRLLCGNHRLGGVRGDGFSRSRRFRGGRRCSHDTSTPASEYRQSFISDV